MVFTMTIRQKLCINFIVRDCYLNMDLWKFCIFHIVMRRFLSFFSHLLKLMICTPETKKKTRTRKIGTAKAAVKRRPEKMENGVKTSWNGRDVCFWNSWPVQSSRKIIISSRLMITISRIW